MSLYKIVIEFSQSVGQAVGLPVSRENLDN